MPPDKELKNCRISHTFILCYFNHPFCKLSKKRFLFFSNFSVLFAEACAGMVAFSSVRRGEGLTDPQGLWARSTAEQIMSGGRMPPLMQHVGLTICGSLLNLRQWFRESLTALA